MTARTQDRGVSTSDQDQLGSSTSRSLIHRSKSLHRKDGLPESANDNSLKGKLDHTAEDSSLFDIDEESAGAKNFDKNSL